MIENRSPYVYYAPDPPPPPIDRDRMNLINSLTGRVWMLAFLPEETLKLLDLIITDGYDRAKGKEGNATQTHSANP